ncbi:MAG: hypothetical protein EXR77_14125 [Myxococcales bacterium]|nr:hypothetical protein [Myxococcales bacterium]
MRADSNGQLVWQANFGTAAVDGFWPMAVVADGYLLAGTTAGKGAGGSDNWLVASDRFGNLRWERVWGTTGTEQITNLSIDSTGTIYGIANYSTGSGFFRRDRWGFDSCANAGVCTSLTAKDCDDNNPCTIDTCLPTVGCKSTTMATASLCSDTLSCSTTGKCAVPQGTVEVPAGKLWMGCAPADVTCGAEEKPQHEVNLSTYAIDKTEVTLDQYLACVAGAGCQVPGGTNSQSGAWNYGAAGRGDHPINGISLGQAKAFCAWKGKRLPTAAKWEKAARGGCELYPNQDCKAASTLWPWGKAALTCVLAQYNNGNNGCGTNLTAPVGSKPGGASPYGLLDMAGNVSEWVSDTYSASYYAVSADTDPTGPDSGGQGIKRGGGHSSGSGYVRVSARFGADSGVFYTDQGVRCAVTVK